jgi:integrase
LIQAADPKTSLIISFLAKSGTRISEALNVTVDDITETDDAMKITVIGKGTKSRTIYLSKPDFLAIREAFKGKHFLFETVHGNHYDKVNVTKKIGKLSEKVLGKHISAHVEA